MEKKTITNIAIIFNWLLMGIVLINTALLIAELNTLKYELKEFYTSTVQDYDVMVQSYEQQLVLCSNEKTQEVSRAREELIENCESYMCEAPCDEIQQEVSEILCSKIHSGQGNLYT